MMSNLVETLLDKLIFPSLSGKESPLPKTFSGSQNLVGNNNVKMDTSLISEFHQLLNPDCYTPNYPTMNAYSGVKNNNPYFDTSNFLVSRVSKLFLPSLVPLQDLHLLSTQAEYLLAPEESHFTRRGSILSEIIDQIDLFVNKGYNIKTSQKAEDMPRAPPVATCPSNDVLTASITLEKVVVNPKAPVDSAHRIMNQEFVNRKAKKLNKQSKKRRRRQNKNRAKSAPSDNEREASQGSMGRGGCDIFCDIISVTGQIAPDVTSFVISVEEDADWDVCSDSEWLGDCSEFEVSGLFIGNLTPPSCCPVSLPQEDKESLRLKNLLLSVNKAWEESTLDLKEKPRQSPKVSFVPDQDLVKVHEVENYDRKGEWEIYCHERMRFRRRIDQLESVISPCLAEEHRARVFRNLQKTVL